MKLKKVAVLDVWVYEDDERKVECVNFREDHFGLRLTNSDGKVTKFGLSKIAAEKIATGFQAILGAKHKRIEKQKFIMDIASEEYGEWVQVNPSTRMVEPG